MDLPISGLLTVATALGVALVLVPLLCLAFAPPGRGGGPALRRDTAARIGSSSVFLAVAVLVPMGGDGLAVRWSDARLGLGLLLAAGLLVVSMTGEYRRLDRRQRLLLQGGFAFTATLLGLQPAGVTPPVVACGIGTLLLLGCCNATVALRGPDGFAAGALSVSAAFLALAAALLGVPEWSDLNLGLCGALVALAGFQLGSSRFKVDLGDSGHLCVGFLIGLSLLRLSAAAAPGTRLALVLFLALPIVDIALARACRPSIYALLHARGLTAARTVLLLWLLTAVTDLAAIRLLHLIP
jgi:hypothetical protein